MTDPSGYAKTLALPAGFDAPRLLRYDDVTAHAITRDGLGADVRGIKRESRPDPRDPRRHVADRSGHRGGGTTSTWSGTSAISGTASHSRSASRPRRRLYRLRIPPPEWRAAVGAHFTRPYGPRFVRTNRSRQNQPFQPLNPPASSRLREILHAPPSDHEITCRRKARTSPNVPRCRPQAAVRDVRALGRPPATAHPLAARRSRGASTAETPNETREGGPG
jgi:hypothetical protein